MGLAPRERAVSRVGTEPPPESEQVGGGTGVVAALGVIVLLANEKEESVADLNPVPGVEPDRPLHALAVDPGAVERGGVVQFTPPAGVDDEDAVAARNPTLLQHDVITR